MYIDTPWSVLRSRGSLPEGSDIAQGSAGSASPSLVRPAEVTASAELAEVHARWGEVTKADLPPMGLAAGLRPAADVDLLLTHLAAVEYELARRMDAASRAGALPLTGEGAMATARYWSAGCARRLARAGALARRFPGIAAPWAAGVIAAEHVDALARGADRLTDEEMSTLVEQLADRWGKHTPQALARFVHDVIRTLHPPPDPEPGEVLAYESRSLSFAAVGDTVVVAGSLPRLEGEAVIAAVDAFAEALRTEGDHVPAAARRADALIALVNVAAAAGALPNRGGLPVALSVLLESDGSCGGVWTTSRGHRLTDSERRFTGCSAHVTSVHVARSSPDPRGSDPEHPDLRTHQAGRIASMARTLLDPRIPLAVGRTRRNATPAQRRALAARDQGCVMPGCQIPAEACRAHHVVDWAAGGSTDVENMALLCWAHHRQVDLGMWTLDPGSCEPPPSTRPVTRGMHWPGNNGSPWTVRVRPRARWRP